jgi:hypothetical protein
MINLVAACPLEGDEAPQMRSRLRQKSSFENGVKKKKTVKKLFIFFTVFYFLHRFQLCTIFIYFFSLFLVLKSSGETNP